MRRPHPDAAADRHLFAQWVKANVLSFDRQPAGATPWTQALGIYDPRTNMHFTLKTNPLKRIDLVKFLARYHAKNRHDRQANWTGSNPQGRWRPYRYEELIRRDKVSLDLFWLKDESLENSAILEDTDVIAVEIVEDLRVALEEFEPILTTFAYLVISSVS